MFKLLHIIAFFPGYIFLALLFFFPTEWGRGRSVAQSGRQWRARGIFAPIHSIWIYGVMWYMRAEVLAFLAANDFISYETALNLMN